MVIFLSKLKNLCQKDLNKVETALVNLAIQTNLTLQWIPAHSSIQGNEQAEKLATEGGQLDQKDRYTDEKTIIKTLSKKKWKQQNQNVNQSENLHKLNRPEQVILFRLRTGHNRLNAHMYSKFKVGEPEMCLCNADILTAEHLIQRCQLHDVLRWDMWPEPTTTEGPALSQPGGAEEDSCSHESDSHLCLEYDDKEEKDACSTKLQKNMPGCAIPLMNKLYSRKQELEKSATFIS